MAGDQTSVERQGEPKRSWFIRAILTWRNFCDQWRQGYLVLMVMFMAVWAFSRPTVSRLDNMRYPWGMHPADVLGMIWVLNAMWIPPCVLLLLFLSSFMFPRLNTSGAVAGCAILCCGVMVFVLLITCMMILSL